MSIGWVCSVTVWSHSPTPLLPKGSQDRQWRSAEERWERGSLPRSCARRQTGSRSVSRKPCLGAPMKAEQFIPEGWHRLNPSGLLRVETTWPRGRDLRVLLGPTPPTLSSLRSQSRWIVLQRAFPTAEEPGDWMSFAGDMGTGDLSGMDCS